MKKLYIVTILLLVVHFCREGWPQGVYIVNVVSGEKALQGKLLKQ